MSKGKTIDDGTEPAFPPDEPTTASPIGSAPATTVGEGTIGEACTTDYDLEDTADPNK